MVNRKCQRTIPCGGAASGGWAKRRADWSDKNAVVDGFESAHHGKSTDWTAVGTTGYFPEVLGFRVPFFVPVSFFVSGCPPLVMTILMLRSSIVLSSETRHTSITPAKRDPAASDNSFPAGYPAKFASQADSSGPEESCINNTISARIVK